MAKGWKRLNEEQIAGIRSAPANDTLADLAKRFNTSVATIAKYRNAKKAVQPKEAAAMSAPRGSFRDTLRAILGLPLSEKDLRVVVGSIVNS